jgi:ribosomal protein S18 acetylase RimI-like enzyme
MSNPKTKKFSLKDELYNPKKIEKIAYEIKEIYADNARAVHLYEKLGYVRYNEGMENHREVWFYKKVFKVD